MTKQAIIHVENTEGIIDFAQFLSEFGWTILSANRTEELLKKAKIPVVREQALQENNLYLNDTSGLIQRIMASTFHDEQAAASHNGNIGIVCMNVQPSIHTINTDKKLRAVTRPFNFFVSTILRNSFLNYENLLILCDPADYKEAMIQIRTNSINNDFRIYLAAKALNLVSAFDGGIASSLLMNTLPNEEFMNYLTYPFEKQYNLRSGTNPQQRSGLYRNPGDNGTIGALQKQLGKELHYTTLSDISFAWEQISMLSTNLKNQFSVKSVNCDGYRFVTQFTPLTGTVFTLAVKHKSILGASICTNILDSFKRTYTYDSQTIKDVTFASSAVIDETAAAQIIKCGFSAVVAPGFTQEAKKLFSEQKSTHLIPISRITTTAYDMELINGGLLFQTRDNILFDHWNVKTKTRPGQQLADQMAFGTLLTMASRSYSAVLLKENSIAGISQACKSPIRSVDVALSEAMNNKGEGPLADVLVCDAAISLCESVKKLADLGLKAIIQPGGTPQDNEFIDFCNERQISMIFTDMPHISS